MHFQFPGFLAWAWLLVPVILLFLVRRRPKRVKVSTLAFFKSLAHVYRESPWLRRLKKLLALLIAAATVLFGTGALAQLVVAPETGDLKAVLVVVDGSASMAATDDEGRSRLDVAKARVRERLSGLQSGIGVLLMRYDRRPEILVPHSFDRRGLLRALDAVEVRPVEGDAETALHRAARLAALQAPAAIWHVTDAASDLELEGVTLETINVGLPKPLNVGITGFQLRPMPLEHGRLAAFAQVHAQGAANVEAQLEVRMDGKLVSVRQMTIPPGEFERLLLPIEGRGGNTISLEVKAKGDLLAADNNLEARIPESRPVRLLWVRAPDALDPFTQLALVALGEEGVLEAFEADPSAYDLDRERFDVVLFDGWLPDTWPAHVPVLVMKPPRSLGPVRTAPIEGDGLPIDTLRAVDEHHPVLYGVASDRVAVTQTAVLEAGGSLTPLWTGDAGPLLVAGEVKGQKLVVLAFAADRSERLGLMASYPMLLGNSIFWLARDEEAERGGNNLHTGMLVEAEGDALIWETFDGKELHRAPLSGGGTVAELSRLGLWRVGEMKGSASLLSKSETLLSPNEDEEGKSVEVAEGGLLRGDLRPLLLVLVLLLLVLEAWLFHRHAVY